MIRVTVRYPNMPDARFDHTCYSEKHMAMVRKNGRTASMILRIL